MRPGCYSLDKGAVTFERHLIFRRQQKNYKSKGLIIVLMLTSMVDMFSMLVCFMLQTFSSSPEVLITKGIELPSSFTPSMIKEAPLISIAQDGVYLDQKLVGELREVIRKPNLLTRPLIKMRRAWAKDHQGQAFPGEINLQADKDMSSALISQIMGIVTAQRYGSIQLAVASDGGGS